MSLQREFARRRRDVSNLLRSTFSLEDTHKVTTKKNTTSQLRKSLKISCGCALFFTFNAMNSTVGGELFFQALIFYKKDATGLPL